MAVIGSLSLAATFTKKSLNIFAISLGSSECLFSLFITDGMFDWFWQPLPAPTSLKILYILPGLF